MGRAAAANADRVIQFAMQVARDSGFEGQIRESQSRGDCGGISAKVLCFLASP